MNSAVPGEADDASANEIEQVAEACRDSDSSYNVYMYRVDMEEQEWLNQIVQRADIVLQSNKSVVVVEHASIIKFGDNEEFITPSEYFNK